MGDSPQELWQGCLVLASWHSRPTALTLPLSCQATELLEAILEGYPKSKKQFFVSTEAGLALWSQGGSDGSAYTARLGQLPC